MIGDKLPSLIYDWDWDDTLSAMEDPNFMDLCYYMFSLQKTRLPQKQKFIITTPQTGLSYLLTEEINQEFISYPDWEDFWNNFKKNQK